MAITQRRRNELIALGVLLLVLVLVFWYNRNQAVGIGGVFAYSQPFQPLNIEDPTLRLDLLEKIHKLEYSGTHRNIFSSEAPPPPLPPGAAKGGLGPGGKALPPQPTGPPPLTVPATYYGFATIPVNGKRVAFFTNGEDVFVVQEGAILLNRFRVVKVGNASVDLEEVSTQRHVTLNMELPPPEK